MASAGRDELCTSLCRICLKLDFNLNIFGQTCREKHIAMKLNTCFSLKISETDNKQTLNICLYCLLTLEATNEMREKAQTSDKTLCDFLQLNNYKSPSVTPSSTEMAPPEYKKRKVGCGTNLSQLDVVPASNCECPQKRAVTAKKDNESFQLQQSIDNGENLQPTKQKLYKQTTQKVKAVNRLSNLESHEQLNNKIIENDKPSAPVSCFTTPQQSVPFSVLTRSPPMRNSLQRKRSREQTVGRVNSECRGELLISSVSSTPSYQKSVPMTPKRNLFPQNALIPNTPNTAQKLKASHKQAKVLPSDNENTPAKANQILGKNARSPLTEKVISIANCSSINMQTPKANQNERKLGRKDPKTPALTTVTSAEKKEGRDSSVRHNLENVPAELKMKNLNESTIESTGNLMTVSRRRAIDMCIDKNRAEIRIQTPSKVRRAEELAKKTKSHQEKMKRLEKEHNSLASKEGRDVFEFTGSPAMETSTRFTHVKRTPKRPAVVGSSEICFETRTAKSNEKKEPGVDKKVHQDKRASSKDHNKGLKTQNELDTSLGTLSSSQSQEHTLPVKSITKLLPEEDRESWKKVSGTWASQNVSNESEDTVNDGDLGACMATGDIFGASIARKMTSKNTKNFKTIQSSEQKIYNEKKMGTSVTLLPSPLSTTSSTGEPQKSSISSLNLSSGDESIKISDKKSDTKGKEKPIPEKSNEAKQESTKSPLKSFNLQSKGSSIERVFPAEESSLSDSSDYHLTPKFMRSEKK